MDSTEKATDRRFEFYKHMTTLDTASIVATTAAYSAGFNLSLGMVVAMIILFTLSLVVALEGMLFILGGARYSAFIAPANGFMWLANNVRRLSSLSRKIHIGREVMEHHLVRIERNVLPTLCGVPFFLGVVFLGVGILFGGQ